MSDYIKLFDTAQDQDDFIASTNYIPPHVSCTADGQNLKYNSGFTKEELENINTPLTIVMLEDGEISFIADNSDSIQYCINNGDWENIDIYGDPISVENGDEIRFNTLSTTLLYSWSIFLRISSEAKHRAFGNILSLYDTENFANITTIENFNFSNLFSDDVGLVSVKGLILPLYTLTENCYSRMFSGCVSLKDTVTLPARILAESCYNSMFEDCQSLIKAPELPATVLAESCYCNMFAGCRSLKIAPKILPAEELLQDVYSHMFKGCTFLASAPKIMAKRSNASVKSYSSVLNNMFVDCTSLKKVVIPFFSPWNNWYSFNAYQWLPSNVKGTYVISSSLIDENWNETQYRSLLNITNNWTIEVEDI